MALFIFSYNTIETRLYSDCHSKQKEQILVKFKKSNQFSKETVSKSLKSQSLHKKFLK